MRNGNEGGNEGAHRLAVTWFEALIAVCYVPDSPDDVLNVVHGCVVELREELASPRCSTESAARVGERLVRSHLGSVDALERSLVLLDHELPLLAGAMPVAVDDLTERWSRLRAAFTAGYVAAYVEHVRKQKDAIYAAMLEALRDKGRRLLGRCFTECAATASDAECCGVAAQAGTSRMAGSGAVRAEAPTSGEQAREEKR